MCSLKPEERKIYNQAFTLKNEGRFGESISEFKQIIDTHNDPAGIAPLMISLLYYYELNNPEEALPYARKAIKLKPKNEMASLCLVHCLSEFGKQDEAHKEIQRYVKTGGKIDYYSTLFDENGLTVEDFT